MSKYNFDEIINRHHTNCIKWDIEKDKDIIPLWVADMDFPVAPKILKTVEDRAKHGIFGYTLIDDNYFNSITNWFKRRHNWNIEKEWIIYTTGVVPAISATLKALTLPGEKVILQTPAYTCFFSSIHNQGLQIAENKLIRKNDTYVIDWEDFEKKCADSKTSIFLLCNPHNPAGRVWTKEELNKMNEICLRHGVKILSDEIHCELIIPGHKFIPFGSVNNKCQENSITFNSPTKNFNIAGLQIANIICSNSNLRKRIDRVINIFEICDINSFGPLALETAYNDCEDWIDELMLYISNNYKLLKNTINKELPNLDVLQLEGTYLVWVDISSTGLTSDEIETKLLNEAKVHVNSGTMYGKDAGEGYIRINIACPQKILREAINRIVRVMKQK